MSDPRRAPSAPVRYTRDSPEYAQFRPYLALEPSDNAPILIEGILQTWSQLDNNTSGPWYERSLPAAFRRDFLWIPGLEAYATASADAIAASIRSEAWERLLKFKRSFSSLEVEQKIALLRLLGMLGFYRDNAELLRGEGTTRGPLDVRKAEMEYLRANNQVLLDEPGLQQDYSVMYSVAERAAPGTAIRFLAAVKSMTLYAEHGQNHERLRAAERIASETLAQHRARVPPSAYLSMESRYWRTVSYLPFLDGDIAEVDRRLDRAEDSARRAMAVGSLEEAAFARDILYAVLATRTTTDVRTRRHARALPRLAEMVAMDPCGAWQRLWRGIVYFELGRLEEARENLLMSVRLAPPGLGKICAWLDRCLEGLNRHEEAARWRKRAAMTSPAGATGAAVERENGRP